MLAGTEHFRRGDIESISADNPSFLLIELAFSPGVHYITTLVCYSLGPNHTNLDQHDVSCFVTFRELI